MADQAIPILPSSNLDDTVEFYGRLGFQVMARHRDPDEYLMLRRGEIELHFFPWQDIDPWSSISGSYIRVEDLAEWYDPWAELGIPDSGIPRLTHPAETDYGMREFALVDFDGNLHRVGQPVSR